MKHTIFSLILLSVLACKAQNPILSLYDDPGYGDINNAYYKDIHNDFNRFEGTWIFSSNNTTLTIVLQKKEMQLNQDNYISFYEDLLIGEYHYVVTGGLAEINTLNNLNNNHDDPYEYSLVGNTIIKPIAGINNFCNDCAPGEIAVSLSFSQPDRFILGSTPGMTFHHYIEDGVEKLKLYFYGGGMISAGLDNTEPQYTSYTIPYGEYILIKQ